MKPKYVIGNDRFAAVREFTDRNIPQELIRRKIEKSLNTEINKRKYDILYYYGVGGIGKTRLQKEIINTQLLNRKNICFCRIDFADTSLIRESKSLINIRKQLKKINFPHFDLAYTIYFNKCNPELSINDKNFAFSDEVGILKDFLTLIDGFGFLNAATSITKLAYKNVKKITLKEDVKQSLQQLENLSVTEIEQRLSAFLAYDLYAYCNKKRSILPVFLFDTFENIQLNFEDNYYSDNSDKWIRELILQMPYALFFICGRNKLQWSNFDSSWNKYLDQHLIDCLSNHDSKKFLQSCKIHDEIIINKIIESCEGHPYLLDLSVDTYFELIEKNIQVSESHFVHNSQQVFENFIKHIDLSEVSILIALAVPKFYNYDIFELLIKKLNIPYALTMFKHINRFSFIGHSENKFTIHNLVKKSLINQLLIDDDISFDKINGILLNYFIKKNSSNYLTMQERIALFDNITYHLSFIGKIEDIILIIEDRISNQMKTLQLSGEVKPLSALFSIVNEKNGISLLSNNTFNIMVDIVHLQGKYVLAVEKISERLRNYNLYTISNNEDLLLLKIREIHHKMFFIPIDVIYQEMVRLYNNSAIRNCEIENEMLFMLGGNLGFLKGDLLLARKYLLKCIRNSIKLEDKKNLCRALRKYGDILRSKNHLKFASKTYNRAIQIANNENLSRYKIYLLCSKAELERNLKNYKLCKKLLTDSREMALDRKIMGWVSHTYLVEAEMLLQQSNFNDATQLLLKAQDLYESINQKWGLIQVKIAFLRIMKIQNQANYLTEYFEAEKLVISMGYKTDLITLHKIQKKNKSMIDNKLMFL